MAASEPENAIHLQTVNNETNELDDFSIEEKVIELNTVKNIEEYIPSQLNNPNTKTVVAKNIQKNAVQRHGKIWEIDILQKIYCLTENEIEQIKTTSVMDCPSYYNHIDSEPTDVAIKTTNSPSVCMSDCLRMYDNISTSKKFHVLIIQYEQNGNEKQIKNILEINITNMLGTLFGDINRDQLEKLVELVKLVPTKRKPTGEERKAMYSFRDKLHDQRGVLSLNIKCNSTNSRLQCSIPNINKFKKDYPNIIVRESSSNLWRGNYIIEKILSTKRSFRPK